VDLLSRDVDVRNERQRSWFAERFTAYIPGDYAGIVREYMAMKEKVR
jgi:hypothetical protein